MSDPIRGVGPGASSSQIRQNGAVGTATSAAAPVPATSATATSVDSADVARAEALLAAISAAAGTVPEVDQARVAELQQQLQSGSYQVNPGLIAEKMSEIEALLVH